MKAVLVKNDSDDYELIEVEVLDDSRYIAYKGRVYDFCGIQDGVSFFSNLHPLS